MDHITTDMEAQGFLSPGVPKGASLGERTVPPGCSPAGAERIAQGGPEDAHRADPPLLTGGSLHTKPEQNTAPGAVIGLIDHLAGVSVDWLTVTVGPEDRDTLLALTELEEPGLPKQGFRSSERRLCIGGQVWRRYEARQESKRWGLDYESWECSGGEAGSAGFAMMCRGLKEVRPTRVDIAFDLAVNMTADELADLAKPHMERAGLTGGISGQGGINTRYIGSPSSDRRIRIYRKDFQSTAWKVTHGETLRVELILKADQAAAFWEVFRQDIQRGYMAAAAHIFTMSGISLHAMSEVPETVPVEGQSEAAKMAAFFQQYGPYLDMMRRAGVPIERLCRASVENTSRQSICRISRRMESIQRSGVDLVSSVAERILFS